MWRPSKREQRLLVALGILAIALWLGIDGNLEREPHSRISSEWKDLGTPPEVHMELLEMSGSNLNSGGRNLFAYHVPKVPQQRTPPTRSDIRKRPLPSSVTLVHHGPAEPSVPRPAFDYVGHLGPKDDLIAVFNRGADVFVAQVGEIIDGRFRVLRFRHQAVVLGLVGGAFPGEGVELHSGHHWPKELSVMST